MVHGMVGILVATTLSLLPAAAVRSDLAFAGFVPGSDGLLFAHDELSDGRIVVGVWRAIPTRGGDR